MICKEEKILSIFLLVYFLSLVYIKYQWNLLLDLFWLCNILLPLFVVALFFNRKRLLGATILLSILIQVPWLVDASYYLLTGNFLFPNVADYISIQPTILNVFTMHHAFLPIISVYLLYRGKLVENSWKLATIILSLSFILGFFFNKNYVTDGTFSWFIIKFVLLIAGLFLLEKIIKKISLSR